MEPASRVRRERRARGFDSRLVTHDHAIVPHPVDPRVHPAVNAKILYHLSTCKAGSRQGMSLVMLGPGRVRKQIGLKIAVKFGGCGGEELHPSTRHDVEMISDVDAKRMIMDRMRERYQQRELFESDPDLITQKVEDQWFDRKSFRIGAAELANVMIGFANADGGTLLVGVENDGRIMGVDSSRNHLNELQQAALEYTAPPVRHTTSLLECLDHADQPTQVLVIEVYPSDRVHHNRRDEVYLRAGDQTRQLGYEARQELMYDKGESVFDGTANPEGRITDLEEEAVSRFGTMIGIPNDIERSLRVRNLVVEREGLQVPTWGSILLFAPEPDRFLPGAMIRLLRYDGLEPRTGTRSNLIFDRRIGGSLPEQIARAEDVMLNQLRHVTRLDETSGLFTTVPELPRFAWLESIVNAVTHRSYSLQGDHIRVRMFDDRVEVESPGRLPGPVRIDNIRRTRFSRNPRLSRTLADLKLVQELNEGMNRMFEEMTLSGLPEPLLTQTDAGFRVSLFNANEDVERIPEAIIASVPNRFVPALALLFQEGRITTGKAAEVAGVSAPTARRYLRLLDDAGWIERRANSIRDPHSFWTLRGRRAHR